MKTTEENNRMIAEFMGYEFNEEHDFYVDKGGNCSTMEELRFNNSWDWLMPVLEKIRTTDLNGTILEKGNIYSTYIVFPFTYSTEIQRVYDRVVEFIEWYNEQNHNHATVNP